MPQLASKLGALSKGRNRAAHPKGQAAVILSLLSVATRVASPVYDDTAPQDDGTIGVEAAKGEAARRPRCRAELCGGRFGRA